MPIPSGADLDLINAAGSYGAALAEAGTRSRDDGTAINRVSFMVDMARRLGLDTSNPDLARETYSDVEGLTPEQLGAISALTEAGIVQGTGDGKLDPSGDMQRAHAAGMFDKAGIDSSTIFQENLDGALLGAHADIALGRAPEPDPGTGPDPLEDARYGAFLANTGLAEAEVEAALQLGNTQSLNRQELLAEQRDANIAQLQATRATSIGNARQSRDTALENSALRIGQAQQDRDQVLARAQDNYGSRIAADAAIFDDRRMLSERGVNQDFESRGFYRATARGDEVDRQSNSLDLNQAAQDNSNRQVLLNSQLSANQQYAGAQTADQIAQNNAESSFDQARERAITTFQGSRLAQNNAYNTAYQSNLQGTQTREATADAEQGQLARELSLEEIEARRRLTERALTNAGGY